MSTHAGSPPLGGGRHVPEARRARARSRERGSARAGRGSPPRADRPTPQKNGRRLCASFSPSRSPNVNRSNHQNNSSRPCLSSPHQLTTTTNPPTKQTKPNNPPNNKTTKKTTHQKTTGQIGYALCPMVAAGRMLGPDQRVVLHLLDIPPAAKALEGVRMELLDAAFPLLEGA